MKIRVYNTGIVCSLKKCTNKKRHKKKSFNKRNGEIRWSFINKIKQCVARPQAIYKITQH